MFLLQLFFNLRNALLIYYYYYFFKVQINIQAGIPQPKMDFNNSIADDDIDAALTDLQVTLEGSSISNGCNDITQVPKLYDYLRFLK